MSASNSPGCTTFAYADWVAMFPEFASVAPSLIGAYFNIATAGYLDNGPCSRISGWWPGGQRTTLLYLLTAHIAALFAPVVVNGQSQSPSSLVGRISNASEGSVSVAVDFPQNPNSAWWNQTKYGAAAFAGMARYRMMRYRPGPQRYLGTSPPMDMFGSALPGGPPGPPGPSPGPPSGGTGIGEFSIGVSPIGG